MTKIELGQYYKHVITGEIVRVLETRANNSLIKAEIMNSNGGFLSTLDQFLEEFIPFKAYNSPLWAVLNGGVHNET